MEKNQMIIISILAGVILGFALNSWVNRKPKRTQLEIVPRETYKPLEEFKVKAPRKRKLADENALEAERKSKENGRDKDPLPS